MVRLPVMLLMKDIVRKAVAEPPVAAVDIILADGLFAKQTMVPLAGTILAQHAHAWDHVSFVSRGAVRVWCDGELLGDFEAPHGLMIRAGVSHTFGTLADDTIVSCIHRIDRTGEIDLVEPAAPAEEF